MPKRTTSTPTSKRTFGPRSLLFFLLLPWAAQGTPGEASWGFKPNPAPPKIPKPPPKPWPSREATSLQRVLNMPSDPDLRRRAQRLGLQVLNLTWEDTARDHGSSLGPNISDMTLQIHQPGADDALLPVIRYPNFTDRSADLSLDQLWIRVGNHKKGQKLLSVPFKTVLQHLDRFIDDPEQLNLQGSLYQPRDEKLLVSAQHVFVPLSKGGVAEFNPVIFNYQSKPGDPAVLTLLVTRQGTSAAIIENLQSRGLGHSWGQPLFFNDAGQRARIRAERLSDVKARIEAGKATEQDAGALEDGSEMVMLIQIPLKPKTEPDIIDPPSVGGMPVYEMFSARAAKPKAYAPAMPNERAVISHGEHLGNYNGLRPIPIERDPRFPIRVTVQFYQATATGQVSDAELAQVKRDIERIYADGSAAGSLVVNPQNRPTRWTQRLCRWDRYFCGKRLR